MWSEPRRAHPAGVLVYSAKFLGALLTPAIVLVAVLGTGDDPRTIVGILFVGALIVFGAGVAVALAWAEWYRFTFHVEDRTLRVEHGLIVRRSTRLTPERIQSVDTRANLLFRILGLVTLDVHTAGRGQAPEVSIPALTEEDARALADELRSASRQAAAGEAVEGGEGAADSVPGGEAGPAPAGPAWRLSTRDLVLVSVTSSAGLLAMAALAPVVGAFVPAFVGDMPVAEILPAGSAVFFVFIGLMLVFFLIVAWVMGSVATALMYWDFLCVRTGGDVRIERGLLQRETRNVPLGRVQAVRLIEGPLRQAIGRVTVGVDAAGIASGQGQQMGPTVLHPLLSRAEAIRFLDLMVPGHTGPRLEGLPRSARRRYVIRAVAPALLVTVPVAVIVPYGWFALVVPVLAGAYGLLAYADAGWAVHGGVLALRYRVAARTTAVVRRERIQSVAVSQHPLQAIAGLGTLVVRVASSPQPATFSLAHVDFAEAIGVVEWVSGGVEVVEPDEAGAAMHPGPDDV